MSLTTYTGLLATIQLWAARDDDRTVEAIPDWVTLFEDRARRELRQWLKHTVRYQNVTADLPVGDLLEEVIAVANDDGVGGTYNAPLDIIDFAEYHRRLACDPTAHFPITAVFPDRDELDNTYTLRFIPPIPSGSVVSFLSVQGVGVLTSLSASNQTNRLLAKAPSLYLKGALIEGEQFLEHDERIATWKQEVIDGMNALNLQQERRQGGHPRPAPLPVVFG